MSYLQWTTTRAKDLDEISDVHATRGHSQQLTRAYAVLLASQFQGFCRDLHSESVDYLVATIMPTILQSIVRTQLRQSRQLDRLNAQPGSLGADFGRFGMEFWKEVESHDPRTGQSAALLADSLNVWRNAIVHHNFDPIKLGGTTTLSHGLVRQCRVACHRLARTFDEVMRLHLQTLTGTSPW